MNLTGITGNRAEKQALKYLKKQGLKLIECNFLCQYGEIDLIMQHHEYIVFVEVRYRKSNTFGGALASITPSKQGKLRRSAEYYLISNKLADRPCRFDILCIDGDLKSSNSLWIDNAF